MTADDIRTEWLSTRFVGGPLDGQLSRGRSLLRRANTDLRLSTSTGGDQRLRTRR